MYEFDYHRPGTPDEAAKLCSSDSRYLAGGQSLIQAMRLRLASAENLIDLSAIPNLHNIAVSGDTITIGAMTTHHAVGTSEEVRKACPALAELAAGIGDHMVRTVGTIGGSLANADPAACYPAAVLGLGARIKTNKRELEGDAFFKGLYETALEPGEMIISVAFNIPQQAAYIKYKQPASRFALVGVMASKGKDGSVRVGVTGAKAAAFRCIELEQALASNFSPDAVANVKLSPTDMNNDLHGSSEYRAAMVVVMTKRAVAAANSR